MDAVYMEVPERQDELKRQRGKRQPTSKPLPTNPTHRANPPHSRRWPEATLHQSTPKPILHNTIRVKCSSGKSDCGTVWRGSDSPPSNAAGLSPIVGARDQRGLSKLNSTRRRSMRARAVGQGTSSGCHEERRADHYSRRRDATTQRYRDSRAAFDAPSAAGSRLRRNSSRCRASHLTDLSNNYANAQAQVQTAQAKLAMSRPAFERAQKLYNNRQVVSQALLQAAEAALGTDQAS